MVTDTIGDFITRLKNSYQRKKKEIEVPSSKILSSLANILKKEGFIEDVRVEDKGSKGKFSILRIRLRYISGKPALRGINRVSKPGARIYVGYRNIPKVLNGLGATVLTTSSGLMVGREAVKSKVGGELLCEVW
jgi:small subunit ribosomal protein S8